MDKMNILNNLILEGERLTSKIMYVPSRQGVIRLYSVYNINEKDEKEKYQNWLSTSQRFIKTYFPSDLDEIKEAGKKLSPCSHKKILGILRAIKLLPEETRKLEKNNGTQITINNSQQISINVFTEIIKDEVTGKEYRELKELLKQYEKEPEKTKPKLNERIKKLGNDVLANIVASVLTNPTIISGMF